MAKKKGVNFFWNNVFGMCPDYIQFFIVCFIYRDAMFKQQTNLYMFVDYGSLNEY